MASFVEMRPGVTLSMSLIKNVPLNDLAFVNLASIARSLRFLICTRLEVSIGRQMCDRSIP